MDKTICTFDLKMERKVGGHQIKNGVLYDMSQRKDNENELGIPECVMIKYVW